MISIVISSKNLTLVDQISKNICETIGIEFEIIVINNSNGNKGICQAYNQGAEQAKYPYLCFCHEDILFHTQNWGELLLNHLRKKNVSLVGILGNTIKTKIPAGVYSNVQDTNRINQLQRLKDSTTLRYLTNPLNEVVSEVKVLDGMFLATKKYYWKKQPFDEKLLDGFHGYDIDFSLAMGMIGRVIVIYDILIEHFSFGGNTVGWLKSQFAIIKKWENHLPVAIKNTSKSIFKEKEIDDLTLLVVSMLKLKWNIPIAFKYAITLFVRAPFRRVNLFIGKQLTLRALD